MYNAKLLSLTPAEESDLRETVKDAIVRMADSGLSGCGNPVYMEIDADGNATFDVGGILSDGWWQQGAEEIYRSKNWTVSNAEDCDISEEEYDYESQLDYEAEEALEYAIEGIMEKAARELEVENAAQLQYEAYESHNGEED